MTKYTQLPKSLPRRVRDLAVSLTKDKDTRYDKVLAIENYFTDYSFIYETTNVSFPAQNQDYVDQFLFDTKSGYCNNFSTSMIVLLRSAGIPARWVKGYTEGTLDNTLVGAEGEDVYKIANDNAHSWVEVYFLDTDGFHLNRQKDLRIPIISQITLLLLLYKITKYIILIMNQYNNETMKQSSKV